MSPDEVAEHYGGTHVPMHVTDNLPTGSEWKLTQFLDLFSMPEATLLADIVEVRAASLLAHGGIGIDLLGATDLLFSFSSYEVHVVDFPCLQYGAVPCDLLLQYTPFHDLYHYTTKRQMYSGLLYSNGAL